VEEARILSLRFAGGIILQSRIWFGVWFFRKLPVVEMQVEKKPVCIHCGQPCISMCSICLRRVHQSYGFLNANCSGLHEAVCIPSRALRSVGKNPSKVVPESAPLVKKKRKAVKRKKLKNSRSWR
jgi:hypothetical protein